MRFPLVKVEDFCRTGSGATPARDNPDYYGGNIPWIKSGELRETLITNSEEFVTEHALQRTALKLIPPGAILIAMYGATVGRVGLLGIEATTNQAVCHIVPDAKVANTRYLYHFMQSHAGEFVRRGVGGAQPNISQGMVRETLVPLPPLEEQKRIAAILDQADALRRLRARALTRLNALGQAIFHEMFGDPVTNPKNLPRAALGDVCKFTSGGTPSKDRDDFWDGGIPWVSPKDMKSNEIWASQDHVSALALENSPLKLIRENTPLIVVRGMILAHTVPIAISRVPCTINQDMKALTFDGTINSDFAVACLRAQHASILGKVATAAHGTKRLDTSELTTLPMLCPSREAQQGFVTAIGQLTALAEQSRSSLQSENTLFTSLQHRAFRGEL